jgi:hypothetical protein
MSMSVAGRLRPGDPAPRPEVYGPEGPVSLAMAWVQGPALITFLRHFG